MSPSDAAGGEAPDPLRSPLSVDGSAAVTERTIGVHGVPLTVARPSGTAPAAGVVVIQEALGVNAPMAQACERLAAQGYLAVAPHLYHRTAPEPFADFASAKPHMRKLNGSGLQHDIADAREYLDSEGVTDAHVGIVGFCMGGTVSLWQAASGDYAAAVTFYGGGIGAPRWKGVPAGLESGGEIRCPWLGLYGDKDRSITVDDVERLRGIVTATGYPTNIVRYPNAGHAFANDPESKHYVADAAADSWAHALAWFDAHLR